MNKSIHITISHPDYHTLTNDSVENIAIQLEKEYQAELLSLTNSKLHPQIDTIKELLFKIANTEEKEACNI